MAEIATGAKTAPWQNLDLTPKTKPDTGVKDSRGGKLTADFNTFLTLLTTQMKAQDPLQPMENTEFIAQLASFSSVEQQVQSNEKLDSLIAAMSESSAGALAKWLDKEVRAPTRLPYDGAPVTAYPPKAPSGTKSADLVVFDDADAEVARIPFTPGAESVEWSGVVSAGGTAPKGDYRFVAQYTDEKGNPTKAPAEVYRKVSEARLVEGQALLRLEGGGEIDPGSITAVRNPA